MYQLERTPVANEVTDKNDGAIPKGCLKNSKGNYIFNIHVKGRTYVNKKSDLVPVCRKGEKF